jgi:hypothetical protein
MALSSLQLVEKLRRLDRELTHCKRQKALRDLLKIILLGFFLYRDMDLRISDIHKRMRTLCEPIEKDIFEAEHEFKQLLESERARYLWTMTPNPNHLLSPSQEHPMVPRGTFLEKKNGVRLVTSLALLVQA